jgi:hypothetical protein
MLDIIFGNKDNPRAYLSMNFNKTIQRDYWISNRHPSVFVHLVMSIELDKEHGPSIEFIDKESLIPMEISLSSLSKGSLNAIKEKDYDFSLGGFVFKIIKFSVSTDVKYFSTSEILNLKRKLILIVQELTGDILFEVFENIDGSLN